MLNFQYQNVYKKKKIQNATSINSKIVLSPKQNYTLPSQIYHVGWVSIEFSNHNMVEEVGYTLAIVGTPASFREL